MTPPDELKPYQIQNIAKSVHGYQVWQCMAKNEKEALEIFESGQAVIIHEELEIQDGDFDYDSLEEVTEAEPEYGTTPDLSRILKLAATALGFFDWLYSKQRHDEVIKKRAVKMMAAHKALTPEDIQLLEAALKE